MPLYEYCAIDRGKACDFCRDGFEQLEQVSGTRMKTCPRCGNPVKQMLSAPTVGRSASNMDDRAKAAGFHKLKKISAGEYEKQY